MAKKTKERFIEILSNSLGWEHIEWKNSHKQNLTFVESVRNQCVENFARKTTNHTNTATHHAPNAFHADGWKEEK